MRTRTIFVMLWGLVLYGLVPVSVARAVDLRFSPPDQTIAVGAQGTLSVLLDEAIEVRTIELTVSFNGNVLTNVEGGSGSAFQALPCFVWEEYTPTEGQWTGFAVSIGTDCLVVGPGELFTWTFAGDIDGVTAVVVEAVTLYDRAGIEIPVVTLPGTTVSVGSGASPVEDVATPHRSRITAYPNPFNPLTNIRFWLPEPREARLVIYDLKGQRVRTLLQGTAAAEWTSVRWNGRTDDGLAVPSGVYFYRLESLQETLSGRVTLTR